MTLRLTTRGIHSQLNRPASASSRKANHYNYFRDYDPAIGRYVQSDPIGLRGGMNTYGYVDANPVRGSDRLGLANSGAFKTPPMPPGSFKYHGYWCGPGWTGGNRGSYSPDVPGYRPPMDRLDEGCQGHDMCYYSCRVGQPCNKKARGACMTQCDRVLAGASASAGSKYSSPLWWWMDSNNSPDPGDNAPGCPCDAK